MRWYHIFIKGIREQVRDYWILVMIVVMAPLFIGIYFLMSETEEASYDVVVVNMDRGNGQDEQAMNLGDSLLVFLQDLAGESGLSTLSYSRFDHREGAVALLKEKEADVVVVVPEDLTVSLLSTGDQDILPATIELVGDVTRMEYIIGAIWTEELVNGFVLETTGTGLPVVWEETTLGFSGSRSEFELYVPGLLILSVIMIIFSASAAIVREPETRTLERLRISRLSAVEFLGGISLVQIIIAFLSLVLALLAAIAMGYTLIPGTLGFLMLTGFLTALSMISFSLIVAAMCRSIKEVAIIGTFPLFLLMFFTGAAFPIRGGKLFTIAGRDVMLNGILSPTWAVDALNKVLVVGIDPRETLPEMVAILILTLVYFLLGTWLFSLRHMRAR